jgi:hypothetical protein
MRTGDGLGNRLMMALLVAAHMIVLLAVPVLHAPAPLSAAAAVSDGQAPADTHHEGACTLCRVSAARFVAAPPTAVPTAPVASVTASLPAARPDVAAPPAMGARSPRAPPRAA